MKRLFFWLLVLLLLWGLAVSAVFGAEANKIATSGIFRSTGYGNIPLYFIPNHGQVKEYMKFYARASGYTLWLTRGELVFDMVGKAETKEVQRDVTRLVFLNANKEPEIIQGELTGHRVNYIRGKDPAKWKQGIRTSKTVLYKSLYDKIDLKVYGIEKEIEYDWIVEPGGNPGDIRFQYRNAASVTIDKGGNLEPGFSSGKTLPGMVKWYSKYFYL